MNAGPTTRNAGQRGLRRGSRAFTLVEMLIVIVIVSILAAISIPNFQAVVEKARVARAIGDIKAIGRNLQEYELENNRYPSSLSELGMGAMEDPWGAAYQYLSFARTDTKGKGVGNARKDRFLVPINSDFDLYSKGQDGATSVALTAAVSHDDIIWANDGGYVGLAEGY